MAGHLVAAGGKRLRPALTLCAAYAALGARPAADEAVTGATAVELVHLGSLYHDDVIDEAETRRGVPSVNARWSNIVAILAGDYLLAQASALAASLGADVAGLLATTIGELCRGQVLELQYLFDADRDEESYFSSIDGKTASLMATVVPDRRHGRRRVGRHARRAHAVRPPPRRVLPEWSTTCSTSPRARPSSASRRATTSTRACTRCR